MRGVRETARVRGGTSLRDGAIMSRLQETRKVSEDIPEEGSATQSNTKGIRHAAILVLDRGRVTMRCRTPGGDSHQQWTARRGPHARRCHCKQQRGQGGPFGPSRPSRGRRLLHLLTELSHRARRRLVEVEGLAVLQLTPPPRMYLYADWLPAATVCLLPV